MITIQLGDRGNAVQALQTLLNSYLSPPPNLREDGEFGPGTREAVVKFQKSKALEPSGTVDMKTWFALGLTGISQPMVALSSLFPWMRVAHGELLIHANSSPVIHNQRIVEYHQTTTLKATDDETFWCSSFVNWVMIKSGKTGTNSAAAKSWLDWGSALEGPKAGAVTIIKKKQNAASSTASTASGYHVAFLVSLSASTIRLLGGNQSKQVKYSDFPLSAWDVKGYRWPK